MKHALRKLMLALTLLLAGCAGSTSQPAAAETKTYTGLGTSMEGSYIVHVTLEGSDIRDVTVDAQFPDSLPEEFRQQGIDAVNATAAKVIENNAPVADMISGATVTCQAVLDGVSDCLNQAGLLTKEAYPMKDGTYQSAVFGNNDLIEVEVTIEDQAIKAVTVNSEHETAGIG
ncbi:MAG: FMN-binding protein, partial [Solobacterium sp.]|nr:FMN-binding protein [Solobacterium sp.]